MQSVTDVVHAIGLAVAPVFLLTGVGSLLSVMTNRLARVIDRSRYLETTYGTLQPELRRHVDDEFCALARRARFANWAINFSTAAAFLVCTLVAALFVDAVIGTDLRWLVGSLFIGAMLLLIGGLTCFLREVYVATHTVHVGPPR